VKEVIKSIPSVFKKRTKARNAVRFLRFGLILVLFVYCYMQIYTNLMSEQLDGAEIGWVESFYWVLTTMSTLGYGDIVFTSESGRLFSMLVMFTWCVLSVYCTSFCFHGVFVQTLHGIPDWCQSSTKI
jgi:hypothetical protein